MVFVNQKKIIKSVAFSLSLHLLRLPWRPNLRNEWEIEFSGQVWYKKTLCHRVEYEVIHEDCRIFDFFSRYVDGLGNRRRN